MFKQAEYSTLYEKRERRASYYKRTLWIRKLKPKIVALPDGQYWKPIILFSYIKKYNKIDITRNKIPEYKINFCESCIRLRPVRVSRNPPIPIRSENDNFFIFVIILSIG